MQDLVDKIVSLAKREGFVTFKTDIQTIPKNGSNYLSDLYEIGVKGKTVENDKEIAIFAKKIVQFEGDMTENLSINLAFQNELFAYKELSQILNELQEEYRVLIDKRFKMVKCYDESDEHVIILENVTLKGFETYGRMAEESLKYVELSIEELAKFHALSFVLQNIRPAYYESKIKKIKSPLLWTKTRYAILKDLMRVTVKNMEDVDIKKKMEEFVSDAVEKYEKYFKGSSSEILCLCHGDYRPLNVMVKELDGIETEVVSIDYQLMYYGCPINDLMFCLFSNSRHMGSDQINQLKDLYYTTLINFSKNFNVNVEDMVPRTKFEKKIKERMDYGLIAATVYAPLVFALEQNLVDYTSNTLGKWEIKLDDKFNSRFTRLVKNFIEWGYF